MVNKNYSIEQPPPPPILTTFQNITNNNDKNKLPRISTKNTIDPYDQMVFNNNKNCEQIDQCTTGHHHHVQPKNNLTINEIGRFQYILQMDREMATHRQSQSTIDSTNQFDSINIWKTDTTTNNLKFISWCRQNIKHSIWPIIFLVSCILLGCLIFFLFLGSNNGKKQNSDDNYLPSDYSEHRSKIENFPELIDDNHIYNNKEKDKSIFEYPTTEEFEFDLDDKITTTKSEEINENSNVFSSPLNNSHKKDPTQIRLILKPSNNDWIKTTTRKYELKTILKSITTSTEDTIPEVVTGEENQQGNSTSTISTTTTESIIVKVSPTIPLSITKSTTEYQKQKNIDLGFCVSASLGICQGILQYDLTTVKSHRNLDSIELEHFQYLFNSKCSKRSAEFVCSALEPECRPNGILQPCKRICKSILEPCASIIASSEILTTIFDCDQYPDSNDRNVCEDPTRRGDCNSDEFSCSDSTCIPKQWKCDNIKDCAQGEDEEDCIFCDHEEFQCKTTNECIPEKYICDGYTDCIDGSDEDDCYQIDDENNTEIDYSRVYSFATIMAPENQTKQNQSIFSIFDYDNVENITESIVKDSVTDTNDYDEMQRGEASGRVVFKIPTNLANFQESKEVMMTSDSENDFKYSPLNRTSTSTEPLPSLCPADQLRCVSGKCITVDQLCDKITDCPDGSDEAQCVYKN